VITADLSGIGAFIGAVEGTLHAVESPGFKGDFLDSLTGKIKRTFMLDAIAAKESGLSSLNHMFEWGNSQGETSNVPLFAITKRKAGPSAVNIGFKFLPSTKPVPLPDPARYGFNAGKLKFLTRHVFYMKAVVMETQSSVVVSPTKPRGLFIPLASAKKGYIMSKTSVRINPGGSEATGGFATFWSNWFESRGNQITSEFTRKVEQDLGETGRKVVRYAAGTVVNGRKVGGQFASGKGVSVNYVNAKSASAQQYAERLLRAKYRRLGDDE
jgi:hypothetical protein